MKNRGWKAGWRVSQEKEFPRFRRCLVIRRFMEFVKFGRSKECWEWLGSRSGGGWEGNPYGQFIWREKGIVLAHVTAYVLFVGSIPRGKVKKNGRYAVLQVCHSCDNTLCVNPAHLWLGTQKENVDDSVRKQRRAVVGRGKGRGWTSISRIDVEAMVKLYESGEYSLQELADKYGLVVKSLRRILRQRRNG